MLVFVSASVCCAAKIKVINEPNLTYTLDTTSIVDHGNYVTALFEVQAVNKRRGVGVAFRATCGFTKNRKYYKDFGGKGSFVNATGYHPYREAATEWREVNKNPDMVPLRNAVFKYLK